MKANALPHEKKKHILDATTDVLVGQGIQALSFENIANSADLSRQLIRYYYPNLDTLMCDLCDHLGQAYQETLVQGIVKVQQVGRLDFFLDFFFGVSETQSMPPNLEAYDAMVAYSVGSEKLRERMRRQYEILGQVMVHELAVAHPTLDVSACKELSFLFVSAMHAHWSFVASLGYSTTHNRLARNAFQRQIDSYISKADYPIDDIAPWSRTEET